VPEEERFGSASFLAVLLETGLIVNFYNAEGE
jgi:hypothetical protein